MRPSPGVFARTRTRVPPNLTTTPNAARQFVHASRLASSEPRNFFFFSVKLDAFNGDGEGVDRIPSMRRLCV